MGALGVITQEKTTGAMAMGLGLASGRVAGSRREGCMGSKSGQAGDWTRTVYKDNRVIRGSGRGCGGRRRREDEGVGADPDYFSVGYL